MTHLETLQKIAAKATPDSRQWRRHTKFESPVGYDLEQVFAIGPIHRDNPRKDHFDLAVADAEYIATFNPLLISALLEDYAAMKSFIVKISRLNPNHGFPWSDAHVAARELLNSLKLEKLGEER